MHPLDGSLSKVRRAREQINALDSEFKPVESRDAYRVVPAEIDPKTGKQSLRVVTDIDADQLGWSWSAIIGEIAHDLRSALDILICQLATHPSTRLKPGIDCEVSRTGFPIFRYGPRSAVRARSRFDSNRLGYLKPRFRTRLQRLQPYHRRNLQGRSPLWLLHEINNADKHRYIQVVATNVSGFMLHISDETVTTIGETSIAVEFVASGARIKTGVPLKHGAQIGTINPMGTKDVKVNVRLRPQICFSKGCDAVKGFPVVLTLERIEHEVSNIIESFAAEF